MSESATPPSGARYHRRERSPFRVVEGRCLIGAPGHKVVAIGGSAVTIWLLLESPGSAHELLKRIRADWPELESATTERVQVTIDMLTAQGLVTSEAVATNDCPAEVPRRL